MQPMPCLNNCRHLAFVRGWRCKHSCRLQLDIWTCLHFRAPCYVPPMSDILKLPVKVGRGKAYSVANLCKITLTVAVVNVFYSQGHLCILVTRWFLSWPTGQISSKMKATASSWYSEILFFEKYWGPLSCIDCKCSFDPACWNPD